MIFNFIIMLFVLKTISSSSLNNVASFKYSENKLNRGEIISSGSNFKFWKLRGGEVISGKKVNSLNIMLIHYIKTNQIKFSERKLDKVIYECLGWSKTCHKSVSHY